MAEKLAHVTPSKGELAAGIIGATVAAGTLLLYAHLSSKNQQPQALEGPPLPPPSSEPKQAHNSLSLNTSDRETISGQETMGSGNWVMPTPRLSRADNVNKRHPMYQIALTGGPCAGKSTSMSRIKEMFEARGFAVYILPEGATLTIHAGCDPGSMPRQEFVQWQASLMRFQMQMENEFREIAARRGKKALIVTDRGTVDSKAYLNDDEWTQILRENNWDLATIRDQRYHAVIHLTTAAVGAAPFYTNANNEARRESSEEAAGLDTKTYEAWVGHENLTIIDNSTGFEDKILRTLQIISATVGEPQFGAVTKILVKLSSEINVLSVEHSIVQNMLRSGARLSMKANVNGEGTQTYVYRTKQEVDDQGRVFYEEDMLSARQYIKLLTQADTKQHVIRKVRRTFVWNNQHFTLDEFLEPPEASGTLVLQLQKNNTAGDKETYELPPFLEKIRDVTHENFFSTYKGGPMSPA
jgi:predicted ATPase